MRKSVLLVVGIVYFVSILFIAFFGLQLSVVNPTILVERVEFTSVYILSRDGEIIGEPTVRLWRATDEDDEWWQSYPIVVHGNMITETDYGRGIVVYLEWEVYPLNATNRDALLFPVESPSVLIDRFDDDDDRQYSARLTLLIREGALTPDANIAIGLSSADGSGRTDTLRMLFV
ncbi:MAG: hypothetical protein FWE22_03065 [Firmicutes bacterium]|nr:hypothetical protein [Bacillota bacterium]